MKSIKNPVATCLMATVTFCAFSPPAAAQPQPAQPSETIWYSRPASDWLEALPLGNGNIGAMIFGGTDEERIQFNDNSLVTGTTNSIGYYQPFGDIYLRWRHKNPLHYKRELVLNDAMHHVTYVSNGVRYQRECFISHPANAMVMRVTASRPGSISVEILLKNAHGTSTSTMAEGNELHFSGKLAENQMQYEARLRIKKEGGVITHTDSSLVIQHADALTLYLVAGTNFRPFSRYDFLGVSPHKKLTHLLNAITALSYEKVKGIHMHDFNQLYNRVHLYLGAAPDKSIFNRLKAYTAGGKDPSLEALLFQYGRYLLISSSRKGGLPANLQGLWNKDFKPAWYSQYTTNINLQMNYWPAGPANLSECLYPMIDWVENLADINRHSNDSLLRVNKGWMAYSTNNIMGGPSRWRLHRPGSAWMAQHFWEYFRFTEDTFFLRTRAYPMLKELAEYWCSHLVSNKEGKLISPDGWSPEHGPGKNEKDKASYPGASYDQQIVYDLLSNYLSTERILQKDTTFAKKAGRVHNAMLGPQIGRWGQLQEWMEDVDDSTDHHRHNSHLFAVFPGRQISPYSTPALARAAIRSLDARGNNGTGWSVAWRINIRARLLEGNKAYSLIRSLIRYTSSTGPEGEKSGLYPNLFDMHPPFQIDGNFGYTAGVAEMLLQSHENNIHLLPALPDAWPEGSVKGLKARGNITVAISWEKGILNDAVLIAARTDDYLVRYKSVEKPVHLTAGQPYIFRLTQNNQ